MLWEVRQAGSGDTQNPTGSPLTGQTGHVGYVYAGGLDAPIGLIRNNTAVALHYNWKGLVVYGTDDAGAPTSCAPGGSGCSVVSFPGVSWGASGGIELARNTEIWYGQVPMGFLDRTGLVYRRNRFYDPTAGQFTQPDPIGFAGGLNIYGYAGGDPVNGSDPFGLASAPVVEQVDCEYYPHDMQCAGYPPRDPRDRQGGGSTPAGGLGGGGGGGRRGNGDGTDPGALLPCLASIGFAATVDLATGAFLLYGGPATAVAAAVRGGFGVLAAATRPSGQVVARTASWWIYRSGAVSRAAEGGVAQLGANGAYLFGGVVSAHAVEVGFWSDMGSGRSLSDAVINILLDTAMPGRATYRATGCL